MKKNSLSIFFPTYNEEENIEKTVRAAELAVLQVTDDYEIIIVDDGSKDSTPQIADALTRSNPHIKTVHHNPNLGYGAAVWSGIQASTKEYVFFTDADLQFNLNELEKLTKYVPEYDVVVGYRAQRRDPFIRIVNAKGWNLLNRILFGLRVTDIDCAFKLFRRDVVKDLPVESRGAMLSAELLIRLQRSGVVFKEIPVTHLPRTAGSATGAKLAVIFKAFREMFLVYTGDLGDRRYGMMLRFLVLGAVNTAVDWLWYFALTHSIPMFASHLVLAKATAFLIGSIPIFITNAYWVFPKKISVSSSDIINLYCILTVAFFINIIVFSGFLKLGISAIPAVVLATLASFTWNLVVSWVLIIKEKIPVGFKFQNV